MSGEPENPVLAYLRRLDERMANMDRTLDEIRLRMTTLEQHVGYLVSIEASHYASLSTRLDDVAGRLARIERRLDLVDHRQ